MNKLKKYKSQILFGTGVILLTVFFVGLFFVDIGINSKFFIKRDFNKAFQYRLTGDCDSFLVYVNRDIEKWKERCEEEKSEDKEPIRRFKIQQISHKFFSGRAFLQIEVTRNILGKEDFTYSVNYEMVKSGLDWKIDQKIK